MSLAATLTVLGCRGSTPVSGAQFARYGGASTCCRLDFSDCTVFLDAGTGLQNQPGGISSPCHFLLSHYHVDHIYSLPLYAPLFDKSFSADVWGSEDDGLSVLQKLDRMMSPPLWPITSASFSAEMHFHGFSNGDTLRLSPTVSADTLKVSHPGGCTAYRINAGGKTLVFSTDTELTDDCAAALAEFARGCDLLMLDAQYTDEEYSRCRGFGHSSWSKSLALIEKCAPRRALLIHHDPLRTDDELDALAARLPENIKPASEGMVISL